MDCMAVTGVWMYSCRKHMLAEATLTLGLAYRQATLTAGAALDHYQTNHSGHAPHTPHYTSHTFLSPI